MKYFLVTAKCGHVGNDKYYEGAFPVIAEDAKEAAKATKEFARVKRDHKDAILNVVELNEEEYYYYLEEYENQIYFWCNSKKEQKEHWAEIEPYVREETDRAMDRLADKNCYYRKDKHKKGIRNPYKYSKYNDMLSA